MGIIQIAGIKDLSEAELLISLGVTDLGFPLGPGVRTPDASIEQSAEIVRHCRRSARCVLITYLSEAPQIIDLCEKVGTSAVQLHGDISTVQLSQLKVSRPQLFVMRSLVVAGDNGAELETLVRGSEGYVDAFLTDTFDPTTGARGATGKTHDWRLSRRLVESTRRPVILAGGLTPENVAAAILEVRPAGVDSHTGVEGTDGRKDRERVESFVREAKRSFSKLDFDHVAGDA